MATVKYLDTKLYDFLTLFLSACCIKSDSDIQPVLSPMLEVNYLFRIALPTWHWPSPYSEVHS